MRGRFLGVKSTPTQEAGPSWPEISSHLSRPNWSSN